MALALGLGCTSIVTEDGNLYAFGRNDYGQLGVGTLQTKMHPEMIDPVTIFDNEEVLTVAAGGHHGACVTKDGSLWTWGPAEDGRLGHVYDVYEDDIFSRPERHRMERFGFSRAMMVCCGSDYTMLLTEAGHVWNCGYGGEGALGHGDLLDQYTLTQIDPARFGGARIEMITSGEVHCLALESGGDMLWAWGSNSNGELGNGNGPYTNASAPEAMPMQTFQGQKVVFINAGSDFSQVVTEDGAMWASGSGALGQLGLGDRINRSVFERAGGPEIFDGFGVRMLSCGFANTLIVTQDDKLWVCGAAEFAMLGDYGTEDRLVPVVINPAYFQGNKIVVVGAGRMHAAAITEQGRVYTWGMGQHASYGTGPDAVHSGGLGHGANPSNRTEWTPHMIPDALLGNKRMGHWHQRRQELATAFFMGIHTRLGADCDYRDAPWELLQKIFGDVLYVPPRCFSRGLRDLMGLTVPATTI